MKYRFNLCSILIITVLSLTACGGNSTKKETGFSTNHPEFFRDKVTLSASYSPTGEITETMPTFSWRAVPNATEYHFGHEATDDDSQWLNYFTSSSAAGCLNTGDNCEYTPSDYTFPLQIEKVWWVRAKVNGSWQNWSRPIVFTVVAGNNSTAPSPISPTGNISTTNPEFSWTGISGASKYQLGYEDANTSFGWELHELTSLNANCQTGQACHFTPSNPNFTTGQDIAWWVKAKVNGTWSEWSEAGQFSINQTQATRPLVLKVNPYIRRCTRPNNTNCRVTNVFTINTIGNGYNYNVDCNSDGILEATNINSFFSCRYNSEAEHRVTISGAFPQIYKLKANKLLEVEQWGTQKWRSMESAFELSPSLMITATDTPDLSAVTSMKNMFKGVWTNTFNNIENWDISNVNDMSYLFANSTFNQDINQWSFKNVNNMEGMFSGNEAFSQNISQWDVSNVTNMSYMFSGSKFNNPINEWTVRNVTNMSYMFSSSTFNQNINDWDVSNVTDVSGMFSAARQFNQSLSNWDVSNVTDMSNMFASGAIYNQDISQWNVSNVENMHGMFVYHRTFNQDISNWDVSNVTNMGSIFLSNKAFNSNITNWDVSNVTNMSFMFGHTTIFDQDISNWKVGNVTNMQGMFTDTSVFNQDISGWDVSNVANMNSMFRGTISFNQDINEWDVSNVINMGSMFAYVKAFNQDINAWDVSNVKDMHRMFFSGILTTNHYDNILNTWSALNLQNVVRFSAGNTKYSPLSATFRDRLINTFGWIIDDGGQL